MSNRNILRAPLKIRKTGRGRTEERRCADEYIEHRRFEVGPFCGFLGTPLKHSFVLSIALAIGAVAGCASPGLGSGDYSRTQTRGEQSVRMGVVEQVRPVKIE